MTIERTVALLVTANSPVAITFLLSQANRRANPSAPAAGGMFLTIAEPIARPAASANPRRGAAAAANNSASSATSQRYKVLQRTSDDPEDW